jgi:hypothetical protein
MIIKKTTKKYELPDEGVYLAVLADVEDRGEQMTPWGVKEQIRLKWLLQQVGKDGKELSVIATYNKSLDDRSKLVAAITDITGTPPGEQFEMETLIGAINHLTIKHQKKQDGSIFPKLVAMLRPAKGDPVLGIPAWFRRAGTNNNAPPSTAATTAPLKAAVQNMAATAKPVPSPPVAERKAADPVAEPPESEAWDPAEYDEATSFPNGNAASDKHAA